ncbi:hypothetical protein TCDM_07133 [Trypanosoma cruzi Dm28c]|uniref:Uncharacterized protein n=1 Tax=Trypanosoma cruzi Dm28c TaxID=1416333 RepID=V5BF74_TRYCR|nr:hypothetical protein TCDM_07133 [Trypanosoma cruzi Dm28c]
MPHRMGIGLVERHRGGVSRELPGPAAAAAASGVGGGVIDEGDNYDEGPRPSSFVPTPEPRVPATASTAASASFLHAGISTSPCSTRAERNTLGGSLSISPVMDGASLRRQVRRRSSVAHVRRLDLSTTVMDGVEWSWLCRDVLPTMSSLIYLGLAQMGLTDKRLVELIRECHLDSVSRSRALPLSSSSSLLSRRSGGRVASKSIIFGDASSSPTSREFSAGRKKPARALPTATGARGRRELRGLSVLDLRGNHLTHRSAAPLGKLLLCVADTLDELHLSGNPLQDYGLQILGIYLAKLQLTSLRNEQHFFPPSLVQQYAAILKKKKREAEHEVRLRDGVLQGPTHTTTDEWLRGENGGRNTKEEEDDACGEAQIHLGISFLDLRDCQGSARGISEVLAGASRAHRLETILLAGNGALAAALIPPKSTCTDGEMSPPATGNRGEGPSETNPSPTANRFSSFQELQYPCALSAVNLCRVPLSIMCTPIGCRELFLNIFFCCPKLILLDVSRSLDFSKLPTSLLQQVLMDGREPSSDPRTYWRLQRELEGVAEFTLDAVMIGRQSCVGSILCELVAHAAFNAQRRQTVAPSAFCYLKELYLNGTGVTDVAVRGLAIAVSSSGSTGVLSSLTVLDMADNLLTVNGCLQVMHAFILDWPVTPSVLSTLALQGNAGIYHDDNDSILLLQQVAEAAVLKRREERQRRDPVDGKGFPSPLSIYLGAVHAATFSISSGGATASTGVPRTHNTRSSWRPEGENITAAAAAEEKETVKIARKREQGEVLAVHESDFDRDFPAFQLREVGPAPSSQKAVRPLMEGPMGALFISPLGAQMAAPCDVSSIPPGETPRQFLFSIPSTPLMPQRTADRLLPPDQQNRTPLRQEIKEGGQRRRSFPILSPLVVDDSSFIAGGSTTEFIAGETQRGSVFNIQPPTGVSSPSRGAGLVPRLTLAKGDDRRAKDVATATHGRYCNGGRGITPPSSTTNDYPVLQDRQTAVQRETSFTLVSSPNSKAFKFGCLFASMDVSRGRDSNVEEGNALTRSRVSGEEINNYNGSGGGGETDAGEKGARVLPETAKVLTLYGDKILGLKEAEDGESPVAVSYGDGAVGRERQTASKVEVTSSAVDGKWRMNTAARLGRLQKRFLSEPLDESDRPVMMMASTAHLRSDKTNTDGSTAVAIASKDATVMKPEPIQDLLLWKNGIGEESMRSDPVIPALDNLNDMGTASLRPIRGRREKSFVMSYYHPMGHILCRGWRLLYRNDSVGEDARGCVERDVWTLLQPLDTEEGSAVVSSVSFVVPSAEDMDNDAEYGITRLKIVSNERRSVLAERLQHNANMENGIIAFPRLIAAIRRAEEDTVDVVAAMLDAAHGRLPPEYVGCTAEELVHGRHGNEDELMAELGAAIAAGSSGGSGEASQASFNEEECAADQLLSFSSTVDARSLAEEPVEGIVEDSQLLQSQEQTTELREKSEEAEEEAIMPSAALSHESPLFNVADRPHATSVNAEEPPADTPEAASPAGITVQLDTGPATSANAASATTVGVDEAMNQPARSVVGRMKKFLFSFPHREGHCLCRGWRLLHRPDSVGEEARRLLEADVLSFLRLATEKEEKNADNDTRKISGDVYDDASAMKAVESVSFTWEGSSSSTMQLQVVTSERRAVISQRIQQNVVGDEGMLPRFLELLLSNANYDTIHAVETYLQRQASVDLRERIANRYRSIGTLVHYYHGDEAAMLVEIGAASMVDVEATVAPAATDSAAVTSIPSREILEGESERGAKEVMATGDGEEAHRLLECGDGVQGINESSLHLQETLTGVRSNENVVEKEEHHTAENTPLSRRSSLSFLTPSTPIQREGDGRSVELTPHGGKSGSSQRIQNSAANKSEKTVTKNEDVSSPAAHMQEAFAERVRRLQYLAYSAMAKGAILLDKRQRHKLRICKGKWGRQPVTIAVEWDVFLVVYFLRGTRFGMKSHKTLVLVHPVASGVRCCVDVDNNVGSRVHAIRIRLERAHSSDELGVPLQEIEERLHSVSMLSSRSRSMASLHASLIPMQSVTNMSIGSKSSSVDTVDSVLSAPSTERLLQRSVSFQVTLSDAKKAREAVAAICGVVQHAVKMIQQTISEQDRHAVPRLIPATRTN